MSPVELEPVTASTWRDCAALTVHPEQQAFVAPVTYYLCLCHYGGVWAPLAVVRDGSVVGFCLEALDSDDGSGWIGGLVVDVGAQRTGVGRATVEGLLHRFAARPGCTSAALSYHPENTAARTLYRVLGFVETGENQDDGETVARRPLPPVR